MSWNCPKKYIDAAEKTIIPINKTLGELKGELEEEEAKRTLAMFLRTNIGFTTQWLSGIELAAFQRIILKGFFNRNFSMCVYGRGTGKSTSYLPDSKLLTKEHGLISITDLFPSMKFTDEERKEKVRNLHFWNGNGWKKVDSMLIQSQKDCNKVTTRLGYNLEGSTNHKIKVLDREKCKIVWKRYHELNKGDFVCISRNESVNWGHELSSEESDEAYLAGLLVGDGCVIQSGFTITSGDNEILTFCEKYPTGKRITDKRTEACGLRFTSAFSQKLEDEYYFNKAKSYTKSIPYEITKNKEKLKNFLSGLMDTDGVVEFPRNLVSFCTVSETLAHEVQVSLSLFGIISKKRMKKTKSDFGKAYVIDISGEDALHFFQRIGFRLSRKQNWIKEFEKTNFNTNLDVIPGAVEKTIELKRGLKFYKEDSKNWNNNLRLRTRNRIAPSYKAAKKTVDFLKKFKESGFEDLDEIFEENFFFDEIIEKTETVSDCIDFYVPDGNAYWSNGFISHNSFLAAIFCVLYAIFYPGAKIIIAGPTFRTSRRIFDEIEKMVISKEAQFLAEAFNVDLKSRRNDENKWSVNDGYVIAIPLSGEKLRGFRANVLVLDEFLLLPEEIIKNVLLPFLVSPQDIKRRIKIRKKEKELITKGLMAEEDMKIFKNNAKMIALSSASYTFENLYATYQDWIKKIFQEEEQTEEEEAANATYFVSQLSFEALPDFMLDQTVIKEAASGGLENPSFLREYCARFTDGSEGFYSAKKMKECTIPDLEEPTTKIKGDSGKEYIVAIDPNASDSPTSDFFAMCVLEIDKANGPVVVNNFGEAGAGLRKHIEYLYYILTNFNIVMICLDSAGGQNFIDACNESDLFIKAGIKLGFFEYKSDDEFKEDKTVFEKMLVNAKNEYDPSSGRICFRQVFTPEFIRSGNTYLQKLINTKNIWFASRVRVNERALEEAMSKSIDLDLLPASKDSPKSEKGNQNKGLLLDFIESQDMWIDNLKKQCSLIEVSTTAKGTQQYDFPGHLKREKGKNRARRDNYTALVLGVWCDKAHSKISSTVVEEFIFESFDPVMIN